MPRFEQGVRWLILGLGLCLFGQGLYMTAKAKLAYVLLDRAWEQTKETASIKPPWPWMDAYPVARLSFPSTGDSHVVLNTDSGQALAFAPGVISGTDIEGNAGMIAIAAHKNTHFGHLQDLENGDRIELQTGQDQTANYRIISANIIDSSISDLPLTDTGGQAGLVLVTCYPFNSLSFNGPLRYVVIAEPVSL